MRIGKKIIAALAVSTAAMVPAASQAAVVVEVKQVGSAVVATTSGSLDLTGLSYLFTAGYGGQFKPDFAAFESAHLLMDKYRGITGPSSFGPGTANYSATSGVGDGFLVYGFQGTVGVTKGYVSGSALSATTTFASSTLATIGLTAGTYVYTAPHDTITFKILAPAVPEPATWGMMLLGTGAIGGMLRRRSARVRFAA